MYFFLFIGTRKSPCMLHPVVVYYKENGELAQKSLCFILEYLEHDTEFVYEVQRELVKPVVKLLRACLYDPT